MGCNGAMRLRILLDDFSSGECVGLEDANGEPGIELTLRIISDMGTFFGIIDEARDEAADDSTGGRDSFGGAAGA